MQNKIAAWGLIFAISLSFITALFEEAISLEAASAFYLLAGLLMMGFGIYAIIRLFKTA